MKGYQVKFGVKESGSAHVVAIIILVIALLGALGYIFWTNFVANKQDVAKVDETTQATKENTETPTIKKGTIVGSLTYPSESIPSSIEVHAVNLDTGKEYTTSEHLTGSQYQYGTGYRIEVPVGRYNVYGSTPEQPGVKAYYNQVIVCGIKVECKDTTKIEVIVEANKETSDATVGDWWSR